VTDLTCGSAESLTRRAAKTSQSACPRLAGTSSNAPANLASRSRMRNRNEPIQSARSSLGYVPAGQSYSVRVGGHPEDMHPPGGHLHDKQHVQVLGEDRVYDEEVTRQQASGWARRNARQEVSRPRGGPVAAGAEDSRTVASLIR
jgi:hypothetical protein